MKQMFNKIRTLILINVVYVLLFSTGSFAGLYLLATIHMDFFALPLNEKFSVLVGIYEQWTITMLALLVTLGRRVKKGEDLTDNDTENPLPPQSQQPKQP